MATVAGGIILDNAAMFLFGKEPRSLPSSLASSPIHVFGAGIYPLQLIIPLVGVAIAVGLQVLLNRTTRGKRLLAVVQNPTAARLMGIDVMRAIAVSFAASTVLAAVAGMLIAPLFSVSSDMGLVFGIKAFAVAILGGIGSALGVMIAGFLYGLAEALVTSLLGSSYTQILVFSAVIVALALLPNGLFGRAAVKKV
jgi:branched-chain amino acid transport system permease protein